MDAIPFDFEFDNSDPPFTYKALLALEWVAQLDRHASVRVMHWRDQADVGWIIASVIPSNQGFLINQRLFRVSPLGHVYDDKGELVRPGSGQLPVAP